MKAILGFLFFLLFIISCKKDKKDFIAPSEISNLSAVYKDSKIILIWTDPMDDDFTKVQISFEDNMVEVAKGIQRREFSNLQPGLNYTFTLITFDSNGNYSEGIQIPCKIDFRQAFIGQFSFFSFNWTTFMGKTTYCDTQVYNGNVSIIESLDSLIQIRYRDGNQTTICGDDSVFGAHIEPQISRFGELTYPIVLRCSNQSYFKGKFDNIDTISISIGSGGLGMQYGQIIKGSRIK